MRAHPLVFRKVVEIMNVFDLALEMEKEAQAHYEKMSAESGSKELENLFSLLADSEREHYEHLAQLKQGTDPELAQSVALERIKNRLPEVLNSLTDGKPLQRDDDGYRRAIKSEQASIRLYEKLAKKEPNKGAADILRQLAEEEKHHLEVVENIYEFIENPRTYLVWREFSNLRDL